MALSDVCRVPFGVMPVEIVGDSNEPPAFTKLWWRKLPNFIPENVKYISSGNGSAGRPFRSHVSEALTVAQPSIDPCFELAKLIV